MDYAWKSKNTSPGAQIDLLIDRRDDVINVCEMKYTNDEFSTDSGYHNNLENKLTAFGNETGTQKALHLTLISESGLKDNAYADIFQNVIAGDELFR